MGDTYKDVTFPVDWHELNDDIDKNYNIFMNSSKFLRGKSRVRKSFIRHEEQDDGYIYRPYQDRYVKYFELLIECRYNRSRSLRDTVEVIQKIDREFNVYGEEIKPMSIAGVSLFLTRLENDLGISTEVPNGAKNNADQQRRTKDKTVDQRALLGDTINRRVRPQYASAPTKKKKESIRILSKANDDLKSLRRQQTALKRKAAKQAMKLKLSGNPTKFHQHLEAKEGSGLERSLAIELKTSEVNKDNEDTNLNIILPSTDLITRYNQGLANGDNEAILMEMYQEILSSNSKFDSRSIAFLPTPRQYLFLSASEDIVLYGGAAGGGKSYAMVVDALRYAHVPDYKAVIIRKTTSALAELIDNSHALYKLAYPSAKFNKSSNTWLFPSGAKISFWFLDDPRVDFEKFQGIQFQYIGFDELSQQDTPEGFHNVRTRGRSANTGIKPYVRATANPGSQWVYELFIKDKEPMKPFIMPGTENNTHPITMKFIPAKLEDNPHLDNDGSYRSVLESQDEMTRAQLLDGDWLVSEDSMFPEFKEHLHVIPSFQIPGHWNKTCGLDYGYRDPSAGVWFATDPSTGNVVVYDEFLQTGLTGLEFALEIQKREYAEIMPVDHPVDWSIFARTGHTGPTIAESMLSVPGFRLRPADKNREAGWVQIHEALRNDPNTGRPTMTIMDNCPQLIKQLINSKIHPTKPNDLKDNRTKEGHWDLLDALRYGVMSRPHRVSLQGTLSSIKSNNSWDRINDMFRN